jgi:RHS repeat-associated protein
MIDATDAPWRFARTKARDLAELTDPLDRAWRFTWNGDHVLASTTSPSGIRTAIELDERGQPLAVTRGEGTPLAATVRIGRDDPEHPSDITSVTDATGATTRFEHDAAGRIVATIDPLGARTAVERDAAGWVIATTDPLGAVTRLERDPLGGVVAIADTLGGSTAVERDSAGRAIGLVGAPDGPVTLERDPTGDLARVLGPEDGTDTFTRDARGAEVAWTDATGAEVAIVRDALGTVGSLTDPAGATWSTERDALGRVTAVIDPAGIETRRALDAVGAVTAVDRPGEASDAAFRYDLDGRRIAMVDALGETIWTYDALGRVAAVTDVNGGTVSTSFDARDLLGAIGYPDGTTVTMERDAAGRITAVDDGRGGRTTFTWDAAGRLVMIGHGNGTITERAYDALGDLVSSRLLGPDGAILVDWGWERDMQGRVARETDAASGATTGASRDAAGRLAAWGDQAARFDAADRLLALGDRTFAVDDAGRLSSMERSGVVTRIAVDEAGRRVLESSPDGDRAFTWDAAGRLVGAGATTSAYDGDGLRATAEGPGWSATFTWLRVGAVPQLLGDGDRWFVWGPGGLPLEQVDPDGTVHWLHVDQAGSVRAITDASGVLVARRDWDAWGSPLDAVGDASSPLGFQGRYTDPGTGLQVLPQRVYDPATGRFLSVDPQLLASRDAYGFAAADPLTFTDPTGGQPEAIETQGAEAQVAAAEAMASVTELLGSTDPGAMGGATSWMLPFSIGVGTPFGEYWTPPGVDWDQASAGLTCSNASVPESLDVVSQQIVSNILEGSVIPDGIPDNPLLNLAEILNAAIQGPFPAGAGGSSIQPIPVFGL